MLTRARKGFTLLELIVVIVILGILAALAIPTFTAVINRSKKSSAETTALSVARNAVAAKAFDEQGADLTAMTAAAGELSPTGTAVLVTVTAPVANTAIYQVTSGGKSACVQVGTAVNGQAKAFTGATLTVGGAANTTGCPA